MDLCSVQVNYRNPSRFLPRSPIPSLEKSIFAAKIELGNRAFEISPGKRKSSSLAVKSMAKKNPGNSSSSSSSSGSDDLNVPEGNAHSGQNLPGGNSANPRPHHKTIDWREFRATLFAREQVEIADFGAHIDHESHLESKSLGSKWAHPISLPEAGSVLVATEKLDGVGPFERTVVLLLKSGTRHPQEGPFGVIINHPLNKKIKNMKPNNPGLSTALADCSLHFGGPLEASIFLVRTGEKNKLPGIEEVIPGLGYGTRNSLEDAVALVKKGVLKPQDLRFYVGYAGWQLDQLREEIDSRYWYTAACSTDLIFGGPNDSSDSLWEEILQLMGGQYSELSQKPKQDT